MRLVIAICSARDWKPQFGASLAGLIAYVCRHGIRGAKLEEFDLRVYSNVSSIANGRQYALSEAIERGFTHVLFLDDDMTFPADMMNSLAKHKADLVTVNYSHKSKTTTGMVLGMDGTYIRKRAGVVNALRCGFGVLLVDLKIPATIEPPHFAMPWSSHHQKVMGEDYFFCDRIMKAGGKMVCDLDIRVGHVGDYEYMIDDPNFEKARDAERAREQAEKTA